MSNRFEELAMLDACGLLAAHEAVIFQHILKEPESRKKLDDSKEWQSILSAKSFLNWADDRHSLSWAKDKATRYWADWWGNYSAEHGSIFRLLSDPEAKANPQFEGTKFDARKVARRISSRASRIDGPTCSPENIIKHFGMKLHLEGLALTVLWGRMSQQQQTIYSKGEELIEAAIVEAEASIRYTRNIDEAWQLLQSLDWPPRVISTCLHFLARSAGFENNPPVPLPSGMVMKRIHLCFSAPFESKCSSVPTLRIPGPWVDKESPYSGYCRFMTLIEHWAALRGWTTTEVSNTLSATFETAEVNVGAHQVLQYTRTAGIQDRAVYPYGWHPFKEWVEEGMPPRPLDLTLLPKLKTLKGTTISVALCNSGIEVTRGNAPSGRIDWECIKEIFRVFRKLYEIIGDEAYNPQLYTDIDGKISLEMPTIILAIIKGWWDSPYQQMMVMLYEL